MHAHKERPERGSVYARNEVRKDVFARGLKKTAVQVCTLAIMHCCPVFTSIHVFMLQPLHLGDLIHNVDSVYFRRLKINRDVHDLCLILAPSRTGAHL